MLGLTGYSSSEDEADEPHSEISKQPQKEHVQNTKSDVEFLSQQKQVQIITHHSEPDPSAPTQGPSLPPTDDSYPENSQSYLEDDLYGADLINTVHSLTMPPIPNFDIPPSPSGSPPPSTAKFTRFLELKKKTLKESGGVHFNAKLASSTALANPAFLDKMMDMAGISTEDSYALAEPEELGLPNWPQFAKAEELNKTQKRLAKKKEREKGERVEFVPARPS